MKKVDSKYTLVVMAAKRARALVEDSPRLVKAKSPKPVGIALEEILKGRVNFQRAKAGIK
jgi:DNA-directed RNA polymerase subunit omega